MRWVQCKNCGRKLGKMTDKGMFENKHGRQIIRAEQAIVTCPKCGTETRIWKNED